MFGQHLPIACRTGCDGAYRRRARTERPHIHRLCRNIVIPLRRPARPAHARARHTPGAEPDTSQPPSLLRRFRTLRPHPRYGRQQLRPSAPACQLSGRDGQGETHSIIFRQYRHWDCIPDPYYGGSEGFENVLDLLDDACQNIADQIETKQI